MEKVSKRAFSRDMEQAPILYTSIGTDNYCRANMFNISEGGMYFESKNTLRPGADIFIKPVNGSPKARTPEAKEGYRGEVVWCQRLEKNGASYFGVGVRFMLNKCTHCGKTIDFKNICKTEKFILCQDCFNHLDSLEDGKIKSCIEEYLLGNVI